MTLRSILNKVPGDQQVVVRGYLDKAHKAIGPVWHVISKTLVRDSTLDQSDVYGISVEDGIMYVDVEKKQ